MRIEEAHIRRDLAEAYREAALAGLDMRRVTEALELLRLSMDKAQSGFSQWEEVDRSLGRNWEEEGLRNLLDKLRRRVRDTFFGQLMQEIENGFGEDPQTGWRRYVEAVVDSLEHWRLPLFFQLGELRFPMSEAQREVKELIEQQVPFFRQVQFSEIYPLFNGLLQLDWLSPERKASLHLFAVQVMLYQLYRNDLALPHVEAAEALAPDFFRSRQARAEYLLMTGEIEEARTSLLRAVAEHPHQDLYMLIGDTYLEEGQLKLAADWYREAIDYQPGSGIAWNRLVSMGNRPEYFTENREEVHDSLQRSNFLDPRQRAVNTIEIALSYQNAEELDKAREWMERAVEEHPEVAIGWTNLAVLLRRMNLPEEAREALEKAIAAGPSVFDGLWGLGLHYEELEDWAAAYETYQRCLPERPLWEAYIRFRLGYVAWQERKVEVAQKHFLEILTIPPELADTLSYLHEIADHFPKGEDGKKKAMALLQKIREGQGESYEMTFQNRTGILYYENGEYPAAIAHYRKAVELGPEDPILWENLGLAYERNGEVEEAEKAYRRMLEAGEGKARYPNRMGIFLDNTGRRDQSLPWYRKAVELDPSEANYHYNLGVSLSRAEENEAAEQAFLKAAELNPQDAEIFNQLGILRYKTKNLAGALQAYMQAAEQAPDNPVYWSNLGEIYEELPQWAAAEEAYRKAIALSPMYYNKLGNLFFKQERYAEAEESYRKVIAEYGEQPVYYENLGLALENQERLPEAFEAYGRALELDEHYVSAQNRIGICHFKQQAYEEAVRSFEKAADKEPNLLHLENLGLALEAAQRLPEAEQAYARALELKPENAGMLNRMGMFFFKQHAFAQAAHWFEKAAQCEAQMPLYWENLATALEYTGKDAEAEEARRRAAALK